eukprot:TRINITY_DN1590_c0_g1_i5.p1 TRINITY_DN1590_c0_g1~~TRINITY_DN1590_c0_g1_i5.p1  ORF type:complete len:165 (+),score=25.93 TRINITY_DN1590_c0_g1_i5:155-649(+)
MPLGRHHGGGIGGFGALAVGLFLCIYFGIFIDTEKTKGRDWVETDAHYESGYVSTWGWNHRARLTMTYNITGETYASECCDTKACTYTWGDRADNFLFNYMSNPELTYSIWYNPADPTDIICYQDSNVADEWIFYVVMGALCLVLGTFGCCCLCVCCILLARKV